MSVCSDELDRKEGRDEEGWANAEQISEVQAGDLLHIFDVVRILTCQLVIRSSSDKSGSLSSRVAI